MALILTIRSAFCQDHILPYCADARHTDDTLFLVCEEDWRIYENDGTLDENVIARECRAFDFDYDDVPDATAPTVNMPDLYYARLNRWPLQHAQAGAVADIPHKAGLGLDAAGVGMMVRTHKLKRADMPPPSMELQDIVKICNQAARHQLGGLVWLCYESCGASSKSRVKARRCSPAHGAMCIAVTAKTARKMQRDWKLLGFYHFDIALRNLLEDNPEVGMDWEAGFVYPPIGSYSTHFSGCELGVGERPANWQARYVQEGTRYLPQLKGHRWHRHLHHFTPEGRNLDAACRLELPEPAGEDLRWFTLNPPAEAFFFGVFIFDNL